jgi:hypothetical protein
MDKLNGYIDEIHFLDHLIATLSERRSEVFSRFMKSQLPVASSPPPYPPSIPLPPSPPSAAVVSDKKPVSKKRKTEDGLPKEDGRKKKKKAVVQSLVERKSQGWCLAMRRLGTGQLVFDYHDPEVQCEADSLYCKAHIALTEELDKNLREKFPNMDEVDSE